MCPRSPRCHLPRVMRVPGTVQPVDLAVQSRPEPPRVRDMRKSHFLPCISCFFPPDVQRVLFFFLFGRALRLADVAWPGTGPQLSAMRACALWLAGLERRLSGCGARAQSLRGARGLLSQGLTRASCTSSCILGLGASGRRSSFPFALEDPVSPFFASAPLPASVCVPCSFSFWRCRTACGILVPWAGIEPRSLAVSAQGLNSCTAREFPLFIHF